MSLLRKDVVLKFILELENGRYQKRCGHNSRVYGCGVTIYDETASGITVFLRIRNRVYYSNLGLRGGLLLEHWFTIRARFYNGTKNDIDSEYQSIQSH